MRTRDVNSSPTPKNANRNSNERYSMKSFQSNLTTTRKYGRRVGDGFVIEQSERIQNADKGSILAIIPAYNEERFIGSVVIQATKHVDSVIVVDDGSSDSTAEIASIAGAIVIQHNENRGKGAALNSGFDLARDMNAEVVVLFDGDGQHRPSDIPKLVQPVLEDDIDMVIGSRYLGVKSEIPAYRKIGQNTVTFLTNTASGMPSTDSWSGYRAFSKRAIESIHFREGGWGVDPEFQFQAREHDLTITEVPIIALYEEKAKRNPIPHGVKTVNAIIRMVGQHRPLLFFGIAGVFSLLAGFATGVWVYERYQMLQILATGIALISVLLIIIGVISLFTGLMLHSIRGLLADLNRTNGINE